MSSTAKGSNGRADAVARSLSTEPETSPAWWFLGTLAVLRNPSGAPRAPTVIELTVPPGGSPPKHVHQTLDDSFLLLDGEVVVRCGDQTVLARAGSYVALPAGIDHTFRVTSDRPARMLLIHATDDFLRFIEAVGTPTRDLRLPPADEPGLSREALIRISAEHDISIIGPPLEESSAATLKAAITGTL